MIHTKDQIIEFIAIVTLCLVTYGLSLISDPLETAKMVETFPWMDCVIGLCP